MQLWDMDPDQLVWDMLRRGAQVSCSCGFDVATAKSFCVAMVWESYDGCPVLGVFFGRWMLTRHIGRHLWQCVCSGAGVENAKFYHGNSHPVWPHPPLPQPSTA